ncbi:MAG: hypothetical protein FWF09_09395, partial [Bacteroidales bacterium]|nr:hypothetical protein [Bacteroidales bacterium]
KEVSLSTPQSPPTPQRGDLQSPVQSPSTSQRGDLQSPTLQDDDTSLSVVPTIPIVPTAPIAPTIPDQIPVAPEASPAIKQNIDDIPFEIVAPPKKKKGADGDNGQMSLFGE